MGEQNESAEVARMTRFGFGIGSGSRRRKGREASGSGRERREREEIEFGYEKGLFGEIEIIRKWERLLPFHTNQPTDTHIHIRMSTYTRFHLAPKNQKADFFNPISRQFPTHQMHRAISPHRWQLNSSLSCDYSDEYVCLPVCRSVGRSVCLSVHQSERI